MPVKERKRSKKPSDSVVNLFRHLPFFAYISIAERKLYRYQKNKQMNAVSLLSYALKILKGH